MFHFKLFILLILTKESWTGAKLKLTVSRVTLQWPYISAVRQQISTTDCCLLYSSQRAETQQRKPAAAWSLDFLLASLTIQQAGHSLHFSLTPCLFMPRCCKAAVCCVGMAGAGQGLVLWGAKSPSSQQPSGKLWASWWLTQILLALIITSRGK